MGEAPTGSAAQAAFFGSLFSLKGRTALVTGSSRGIGHAIALGLAQAGATVILHGTRDSAPLREAAAELAALTGTEPPVVTADLSDDAAVARSLHGNSAPTSVPVSSSCRRSRPP